jgi:transcriptional regulator with XRE-family HTH domain
MKPRAERLALLGAVLLCLRRGRGLTQQELAGAGLHQSMISRIERGLIEPGVFELAAIGDRLGLGVDRILYLLDESEESLQAARSALGLEPPALDLVSAAAADAIRRCAEIERVAWELEPARRAAMTAEAPVAPAPALRPAVPPDTRKTTQRPARPSPPWSAGRETPARARAAPRAGGGGGGRGGRRAPAGRGGGGRKA